MVKCHGFVTIVLPFHKFFFCFLISPTDRNSGPIRTLYGSNDVFCLIGLHVPFQGLEPSNLLGSPAQNTKISTRFRTQSIYSGYRFSIRAVESKLPSNVKIAPQQLHFLREVINEVLSYSWFNRKCIFQDGCRHLGFLKSASISLLLDQSSPKLVGML